jgi:LacI family transcriptional regulator/LacI family repressor for deo operon, udp, cdd, tsx, nupC, and nupG
MPVTIKDLARHLNLSVSTVSYALNNGPKPVSNDVRRRVREAADAMGYRPNRIARSLVTKRTHAVGVVPPINELEVMRSQFMQMALQGIYNSATRHGYDIVLFTSSNSADHLVSGILDARVDGVIFIASPAESPVPVEVMERGLPLAMVAFGPPSCRPVFSADNVGGTRLACNHLWDLGHRRLAYVTGSLKSTDAVQRRDAFIAWSRERGVYSLGSIVEGDFTFEGGRRGIRALLNRPETPTAVVCGNDEMAYGVLLQLREMGIRVPTDMSLVGFDGSPLAAGSDPPLVTVRQPVEEMSTAAMESVLQQLAGEPAADIQFDTHLTVGGTTAPVPVGAIL